MPKARGVRIAGTLLAATRVCAAGDLAKREPCMAADAAVVDTNGAKWIDGRFPPSGAPDEEGVADGCHPNGVGLRRMADAFGGAVMKALNMR